MSKQLLTIHEQIERLKFKKVTFKNNKEIEKGKDLLLKYNYLNIAALKYCFGTGKGKRDGNHVYLYETPFSILAKNYKKVLKLENELREAVLSYETEFKVNFTFFLMKFLEKENISFELLLKILKIKKYSGKLETAEETFRVNFEKEWRESIQRYSGHYDFLNDYHLLIKVLSFGTISKFLGYEYSDGESMFFKFSKEEKANRHFKWVKIMDELKTLIILRNSLCHKECLITFLDKGWRLDQQQGSDRKRSRLNSRQSAINFIYNYYFNKNLDSESIIMKFSSYRLKNRSTKAFMKIKIK